jgi:hypothetical protein
MYLIFTKKKLLTVCVFVLMALSAYSQGNYPFSPEKFKADQEQFIVQEACLTPQESEKFFPVYDEMKKKERAVFDHMRNLGFVKPATESGCLNAIREHDKMDLELKKIEQLYHNKFLKILPASKVYDVIQAEDKFHRIMLKKFARHNNNPQGR